VTAVVELGDWRDVLPGRYDPARAVVITDPPFGLDTPAYRRSVSHRTAAQHVGKGFVDDRPWAAYVADVLEGLPAARHVIRGPATALLWRDYPQPRRLCVEARVMTRRATHHTGAVPYLWTGWAVYGSLRIGRRPRVPAGDALVVRPYVDDGLRPARLDEPHRGLTPYSAALWVVETWADAGMTVVDPFAGTGTIGRAAAALGLDYIGAELEPRWYLEAQRALERWQPSLELA